jgi:hypothetical protein
LQSHPATRASGTCFTGFLCYVSMFIFIFSCSCFRAGLHSHPATRASGTCFKGLLCYVFISHFYLFLRFGGWGVGLRVSGSGFRVPGFGVRVTPHALVAPGLRGYLFMFQCFYLFIVLCLWFRVQGSGFRGSGFGFRVSGAGWRSIPRSRSRQRPSVVRCRV